MKLINCLLIFIVSFFAIPSNAKENFDNKAWYEERFKFFQNYKVEILNLLDPPPT